MHMCMYMLYMCMYMCIYLVTHSQHAVPPPRLLTVNCGLAVVCADGPQTFPRADGLRRISTEEQQRQTVELAATFIASFETDATATADVTDDAEVRSDAIATPETG